MAGEYYVIVTLQGCSSEPSNIINVTPVGIEEVRFNNAVRIYPNPVNSELIIVVDGIRERIDFEILNSLGQCVYNNQFKERTTLRADQFTAGIYIIRLRNDKTFITRKFMKR